jgi:hypothetical protein
MAHPSSGQSQALIARVLWRRNMIERPSYDELHAASAQLLDRVKVLERALERISLLDVGVWPSWEMGTIAREVLWSKTI